MTETILEYFFKTAKKYSEKTALLYKKEGIKVIEWADNIVAELPDERIEITIFYCDEEKRIVDLVYYGDKAREEEILKYVGFGN